MTPGSNLSLKCKKPDSDHLMPQKWTYLLLKEGNSQPLQKHTATGSWAKFSLLLVTDQDSGNYSCKYLEFQNPQRESEASSALEIWVKDILQKLSLSALPQRIITPGENVTLLCHGPAWGMRFALYKEGDEKPMQIHDPIQDEAEFLLTYVTTNHTGNYSCHHHSDAVNQVMAQPSDPLELIVKGELDIPLRQALGSTTILIIFSCAIILFFLFLLAFCYHRSYIDIRG
ncbi:osteoclast-associated immunoglobulin-like receptor [Monodelphis domestica]|uniref:osteoclast-associated immunoglobulin-like receptor n=1 Tax=Monodelphis domestica TaxID=13616 RepID=UPI0024E20920|nr:osteoclast-associated immunoglobulin-like receptor [Monodelphis domestica]